jgi:hypothetical protein
VADRANGRVQVYSPTGTLRREWGSRGLADGAFNGLNDIAIDPAGDVWTADLFGFRLAAPHWNALRAASRVRGVGRAGLPDRVMGERPTT